MAATFVPYLTINDYFSTIQEEQLTEQLLDGYEEGNQERVRVEGWALSKIRGLLKNQYDLDYEFTPTSPYNPTKTYGAHDRVILFYSDWVISKSYVINDCVIYDFNAYQCITANSDSTFQSGKWRLLGKKNEIFHVPLTFPLFSLNVKKSKGVYTDGYYSVGDKVWWNGKTYECKQETIIINRVSVIQYNNYSQIGPPNTFPNTPKIGHNYWKDLGTYTVPSDLGVNGTKFVSGDNRDPIFVQCVVDFALWILHRRISPRNVPENRQQAFEMSWKTLNDIKNGVEMTEAVELQPTQGRSTRWGGDTKKQNGYT